MNIRDKVQKFTQNNKVVILLYRIKWYYNIGIEQITFISSKFPEVMAFLYILERFGITLTGKQIIYATIFGTITIISLGIFMRETGLWLKERKIIASINPVEKDIWEAAQKINESDKI